MTSTPPVFFGSFTDFLKQHKITSIAKFMNKLTLDERAKLQMSHFFKDGAIELLNSWRKESHLFDGIFEAYLISEIKKMIKKELSCIRRYGGSRKGLYISSKNFTREKLAQLKPTFIAEKIRKAVPLISSLLLDPAMESLDEQPESQSQEDEDDENGTVNALADPRDQSNNEDEWEDEDQENALIDDHELTEAVNADAAERVRKDALSEQKRNLLTLPMAMFLFQINRRCNLLQVHNSVNMHISQVKKPLVKVFNNYGVSTSYNTSVRLMASVAADSKKALEKVIFSSKTEATYFLTGKDRCSKRRHVVS